MTDLTSNVTFRSHRHRTTTLVLVLGIFCLIGLDLARASYGIYIGKNLTADGSVFLAGYGDEPSSYWLEIVPRREHPAGSEMVVGVDAKANFPGELFSMPQAPVTFRYLAMNYSAFAGFPAPLMNGGLNEYHLAGRDIWSPSRPELRRLTPNPQRGLNYSDLSRIALERAHTTREAVEIIGQLMNQGLARTVDLEVGESRAVNLTDGSTAWIKLLDLEEERDLIRGAVRKARVTVEVNGRPVTLISANYRLPVTIGGVQIDCPVTRGYTANSSEGNPWALEKAVRLRLWPQGSPWIEPGTFVYPARQRWFASHTQMANEPVYVDGGEMPGRTNIYYHYGLDFGGAEGLVEIVSATDGLVVSAADVTLPAHLDSPARARYDVIYIVDHRNWYYRYSHLQTIEVKPGQRVKKGERLGLLGKEGGSGGWSHLHLDITSRQPSGKWGIQDGYAYIWEAYQREYTPKVIAVARPHHLAVVGEKVTLDAGLSWSATGSLLGYEWTLSDGTQHSGSVVERQYPRPGTYSERLKVTGPNRETSYDFAVVQVVESAHSTNVPPSIHAVYFPTTGVRPGDPVTFKVRTFRTTHGEETWDFGDGTAPVIVKSDGNVRSLAKDGYAVIEHRYSQPGQYLARVERANERGEKAVGHVWVEIQPRSDK